MDDTIEEQKKETNVDIALVEEIKKDGNKFKVVVELYWDRLFRFVRRISSFSIADVEDILQDTFIKAYRNINSFSGSYKFSTWLYQIARTTTIDAFRKTKTHPQTYELSEEEVEQLVSSDEWAGQGIDIRAQAEKVKKIVQNLPLKYREVVILRFLEEKTYEEIIDIVKKPRGTIASLITRGRAMIQKEIEAKAA